MGEWGFLTESAKAQESRLKLAIKYFKDTKEGQNFLLEEPYKDEIKDKKLNFSNKDNNFLQNDKKIKLDEWV